MNTAMGTITDQTVTWPVVVMVLGLFALIVALIGWVVWLFRTGGDEE